MQLLAEHLDVQKAEREVEVEKRLETKQKTISHIVRHEELDVNKGTTGHVTVQDDTKTPFKRPFAFS